MGQTYSLTVMNNSTMDGNICVYQQAPNVNVPGVLTLAWLSKRAHPGTSVTFSWSLDYNFVWSEQGDLRPGTTFKASQTVIGADLTNYNQVGFDYDGAYAFTEATKGPRTGSLYVMQGPNIPPQEAHVGIGMSGFGTFVVPAQPNIELYFTPHPKYWVVFGDYEQGEVIDITQVTQARQVEFDGAFDLNLTLNKQNLWA